MRFNSEAYDKVYPRQKEVEKVETVVETFTPTEDEQKKTSVDEVKTEEVKTEEVVESDKVAE